MATQLDVVFDLQKRLVSDGFFPFFGQELSADFFRDFSLASRNIVAPKLSEEAMQLCLFDMCGRTLDLPLAEKLSWRLAGNYDSIRRGCIVPPWPAAAKSQWILFEVVKATAKIRARKPGDREMAHRDPDGMVRSRGWEISLRALTGLPAGETFEVFWSSRVCEVVKVSFGFSRRNRAGYRRYVSTRREVSFTSPLDFFGLRARGFLELGQRNDTFQIREFKPSQTAIKFNRSLLVMRTRDSFKCPMNFETSLACHACHIGVDNCPAACHKKTYIIGDCGCGRSGVSFDPETGVCLRCLQH